ncbi:GRB2-related adapter protein 2 [Haplochromis burtoni]|uniref:GRB2-related adapter protein 2 n=1 Tax=Haplochromis burtoni TaxID=8153 RepID=UPI0003BC9E83|nr:GRB2-related adapter protein 2 [Haplochromis burtoni]XP_005924261.1 GRB2-related adapter protein 2 [Haplochromis burtoni]XP_005924262.1 GRB2-related adapter protein 2 [Haplochromis burtoni]XP_042077465.1 GRB2-related adapter protein 2 [Haplochromis burtoni]
MEAKGKFDFNAVTDDELGFKQGDIVKIIRYDNIWCKAEMNGQEGLVPRNFLDIQFPRWFREDATRGDAVEFLMNKHVGEFVIRGCRTSPGNFCISVKYEQGMMHYRLLRDKRGHYFLWSEKFTSLNKLVDFYKTNSISKSRIIYLNVNVSLDQGGPSDDQPTTSCFRVMAMCDFPAIQDDELGFNAGDIIEVLDMSDPFWWKGKLEGIIGLFPVNATRPL